MTAADLLHTCRATGITIGRAGGNLTLRPAKAVTPELLAQIRIHKNALLAALEAEQYPLPPDSAAWVPIARQINCGEFDAGDRCLLQSLFIGVRGIKTPICQQARARLEVQLGIKRKEARQ